MIDKELARPRYNDRLHAGYELAGDLHGFFSGQDPVVLAIPRGGVPVAAAIASDFGAHLDLIIPRKIEAPNKPGMALGAITPDRTMVVNKALVAKLRLSNARLEQLSIPVWAEVQRIQQLYRGSRPYPDLKDRAVVIVDDRLTTGYTMMAAVVAVRKMEPARVVVAVPVSSLDAIERVRGYADDVLSLEIAPEADFPVSRYYAHPDPLTDQEVIWTLEHFWSQRPPNGYSETF